MKTFLGLTNDVNCTICHAGIGRPVRSCNPRKPGLSPVNILKTGLESSDPRTCLAIVSTVVKRGQSWRIVSPGLWNKDATLAHVAYRALEALGAHKSALAVLKNESSSRAQRVGASFALKRIHASEVVDSLEKHLNDPKDILFIHALRFLPVFTTRRRIGTRSTEAGQIRGPYYEMSTWEQSSRILNIPPSRELSFQWKWAVI